MTRGQVAKTVAANKAAHPEKYCPVKNCLWRTGNSQTCPRHTAAQSAAEGERAEQNQALFTDPNAPAKPRYASSAEDLPAPVEPYSTIIEADCDVCGGDGRNHDIQDDYEPCEHCIEGKVAVLRNWLGEALQIEAGQLHVEPRREHLTALRHYTQRVVNVDCQEQSGEAA
jgi:hypothetical protein